MRAPRYNRNAAGPSLVRAAVALTALYGVIGAHAMPACAQDAPLPSETEPAAEIIPPPSPLPPPGPLKILSWNVASSPYAIAMRKIKVSAPAWRTSFGSERRTIEAPPPPRAGMIDADVVLLQGITNPRALRRIFPARTWRLVFSKKALEALPKGSVFTAPVSTVEVEAVAIRFREGLRIVNRAEAMSDAPGADPASPAVSASAPAAAPGLAVKVVDRGRTLWFASISPVCAPAESGCDAASAISRWQGARRSDGEDVITGGSATGDAGATPCNLQAIRADAGSGAAASKGEMRDALGCVAELLLQ